MGNGKGFSGVNTLQDFVFADNASFDGTARGGGLTTDGQLWIGQTTADRPDDSGHVKVGLITSPLGTLNIGYSSPNITIDTTGGGVSVDSFAMQTGTSPVVPTAGGLVTFNGATVAAGTNPVRTDGTGANTMALEIQISQAIASTDATKIGLANFDSASFSVDANGFVAASGTGLAKTITGNTGGALSPTAGNWNIVTANSTPIFAGSGSTLTQDFNLQNLVLGSSLPALTSGTSNVGMGPGVMAALTSGTNNVGIGVLSTQTINSGASNTFVGFGSGRFLTSGSSNTFIGSGSGTATTTGVGNTALGLSSLATYTTGTANAGSNVALGNAALANVSTGIFNVAIGASSATSYIGAESSNITISAAGTAAESNVIRIGTQGTGNGQQNTCFVAGIVGVTVSNTQLVTINSSTGQMGVVAYNPSGFPWTDATGATQTLAVNNGYITDRGAGVVYTLPATASLGDTIKIVGKLGLATITPNANQQILIGSSSGAVGVTGTAVSNNVGDFIELICITAGASSVWRANSVVGTWTLTT